MGIKNVQVEDWIELDKTYLERHALKRDLFAHQREQTTQILPGCEDAAFEALYLLAELLPRRFPTMFRSEKEDVIENLVTGETWNIARDASTWDKYHPLEVMGLLSTEDFFLLTTDEEGVSSLRAGAVCFPGMSIDPPLMQEFTSDTHHSWLEDPRTHWQHSLATSRRQSPLLRNQACQVHGSLFRPPSRRGRHTAF